MQNPAGKSIKISFIGPPPHITYNPIGGSDFLIIRLLADKLNFMPKFVPELSYDIMNINGRMVGMANAVGNTEAQSET